MKNIKWLITIVICGFLATNTVAAQELTGKGIKGGLNMAKFSGKDADLDGMADPEYNLAYSVGGFITFKLNERFSIQPEILYSVKGSTYEISENLSDEGYSIKSEGNIDFSMNWLDVPILCITSLQDNIKLFGGPYLSYFLNGEISMDGETSITYNGETEIESFSETEDVEKDEITSIGFGIVLGGAYHLNNNMGIEVRYTLDMRTIDKEPDDWDNADGEYEISDIKNTGLQLFFTYSL